jgi:hypothetical protein
VNITTISGREFNQDAGGARKGPVVITDCGRPAYVPLNFKDDQKLLGMGMSLAEALAQKSEDCDSGFEFDPPRMQGNRIWVFAVDCEQDS